MSELHFFSSIKRGLIIKKEWLDLILSGEKTWEMRSTPTSINEKIALIESGTGLIVGEAFLLGSYSPIVTYEQFLACYKFHRIGDFELVKKWRHPWVFGRAKKYEEPIKYNHPKGAVIWVNLEKEGVINNE